MYRDIFLSERNYRNYISEKLHFLLSQKTPSIEAPIDKSNKGYKLLQTMGWNSGEGLGRYRQGGTEPVNIINFTYSLKYHKYS